MMSIRGKTIALLTVMGAGVCLGRAQDATDLETVLERAASYVDVYEEELGMIIGEENYVQNATWMSPTARPSHVTARERRRLDSDFLLLPFEDRWFGVRSVLRIDGQPVPAPESLPESTEEIIANRTDTQYNIGGFARTINVPTFALRFFRPENVGRFSFEKRGNDQIDDHDTWEIDFEETTSPTLVRGVNGEDRKSRGRLWIDPETGAILRTEVSFDVENDREPYQVNLRVEYEENASLGLLVPDSMQERYESEFHTVEARADYSNFKRFTVRVDQNPAAIVP